MAEVQANTKNKNVLGRIFVIIVVLVLISGGYLFWLHLSKFESTDDAQVDGQLYAISSRINGHVIEVKVDDETPVKAGDVLVVLDPKDYEVSVAKARADLADAVATYQSSRTDVPITSVNTRSTLTNANSARLDASAGVSGAERQMGAARARLSTAQANVRVAQANFIKAAQDVERYKQLISKDEISKQQYDQAVAAMDAARATVDSQNAVVNEATQNIQVAEKNVEQAQARVEQADAQIQSALTGPQQVKATEAKAQSAAAKVEQQKALLDQAELNLKYTTIVAPVDGIVGKKNVAEGQNVAAGQELMAVVPVEGLWITANFKETQLEKMRVGQPVKITVDAYNRDYTGKVQRISGASGARFSLLPPENATGNYVKVVQRIPVRIALDPGQDSDHLLRQGMSVTPRVQLQ
ncbi:MAG TPA: HlyD family secretion protein [Bryobacteraceae bacterium]|nr:HlyD family secretion protein [Bryobacteraceae bacterium]